MVGRSALERSWLGVVAAAAVASVAIPVVSAQASPEQASPEQEAGRWALPPEASAQLGPALREAPLPAGCAWVGAEVERVRVVSRYRCGAETREVVLVHPSAAPGSTQGPRFAIVSPDPPTPLARAALAGLAGLEADPWIARHAPEPTAEPGAARPGGEPELSWEAWPWSAPLALLALVALALGGGVVLRHPTAPREDPAMRPLAVALAAVWVASSVVTAVSFRFAMDDYGSLVDARDAPLAFDMGRRLVSVRLAFLASRWTGSHAPFVAQNLLAQAACVALAASVARRAGAARYEGWVAGLLVGVAPAFVELGRWGSGIQQCLALAWILLVVRAVDEAIDGDARPVRRAGWVGVALAAGALAALTKYPVAALAAPLAGGFGLRRGLDRRRLGGLLALGAGLTAVMAIPMLEHGVEGLRAQGGTERIVENAYALGADVGRFALRGAALLGLVGVVHARGSVARWLAAWRAAAAGEPGIGPLCLALAAVSAVPFLLNGAYYADYYAMYPTLWLGLWLARAARHSGGELGAGELGAVQSRRATWGIAVVAALAFVPIGALRETQRATPTNEVEGWLRGLAEAAGEARPESVAIVAECAEPEATARSREALEARWRAADGPHGVRWALGLGRDVPVTLGPAPADGGLTLVWCDGAAARRRR